MLKARQIEAMRAYLVDCGADEPGLGGYEGLTAGVSDSRILREIELTYEGGVQAFIEEAC